MEERLQKIIADRGYCSRRKAEEFIKNGVVKVNGTVVTEMGFKCDVNANITVNNDELSVKKSNYKYILLNKPVGFLTSMADERDRRLVTELLPPSLGRLFPVGRLDMNTHGALIMTDDGELANLVMHPSSSFPKVYRAMVRGEFTDEDKKQLEKGIVLDDGPTAPAVVRIIKRNYFESTVDLTIHEGRKREVRRMMQYLGHHVEDLERTRIGNLTLAGIPLGGYREIKIEDIETIKAYCKHKKANNTYQSYKNKK